MPSYDIFFYGIVFFLTGILAASLRAPFLFIIVAVAFLAAIFWFSKWKVLAILTIFIIIGAGYYRWDDFRFNDIKIIFNQEVNFRGLVVDDPQHSFGSQTLTIQLIQPYQGKISARLKLYPQYHYGDELIFLGEIEKSPNKKFNGLVNFSQVQLEKSGLGSPIKAALFKFKNSVADSYSKILAPKQAALLAGLNFGERGGFNQEFKKAMSLSGTTHLIALSGQQITIISALIIGLLGYFFSPFLTAIFTLLIILSYVAMTGFELSVVRAAIMGAVVLVGKLAGRIYDPRNSIVLAALIINLFNPKSLVFDLGFQLSFLAILGIIYLLPALRKLLKFKEGPGFLSWRENFLMTLSAQLATAPFLIIYFNNFSPLALIANIMILMIIPLTMFLGFLIGFIYFVSYYLALVLGGLVSLFLNYEIFIINFFAKIAWPINPNLNLGIILIYYLILIGLIVWQRKSGKIVL
jgi:competence protein ComEC